ncbi:MAG: hypothetical protein J0I41_09735 [Filimonas sp.]|nr:hypothetical protein [Filimonas sp.]
MYKKLLIATTLFLLKTFAAYSQTMEAADTSRAPAEIAYTTANVNTKTVAQSIVTKFCLEISFNEMQKQKLRETVFSYMDEKAKIIPLVEVDQVQYRQKHISYFKTLTQKLSSFLSRQQLSSLYALKPHRSDLANSLHYFYY